MVCEAAGPLASNDGQSVSICIYPRSSAVSLPCFSSAGVAVDEILGSTKKRTKRLLIFSAAPSTEAMAGIYPRAPGIKVFCFFSSEKKSLAFITLSPRRLPAIRPTARARPPSSPSSKAPCCWRQPARAAPQPRKNFWRGCWKSMLAQNVEKESSFLKKRSKRLLSFRLSKDRGHQAGFRLFFRKANSNYNNGNPPRNATGSAISFTFTSVINSFARPPS